MRVPGLSVAAWESHPSGFVRMISSLGFAWLLLVLTGCATGESSIITVQQPSRGFESIADRGRKLARIPELNEPLRGVRKGKQLLVSASGFSPFETVMVDGIRFEVAVNDHECVEYIATMDPGFRTPDGISPGSTLADVLKSGADKPWNEGGWAAHTELPSGWSAAFDMPHEVPYDDIDFGMPTETSQVDWVFKRDRSSDTCSEKD